MSLLIDNTLEIRKSVAPKTAGRLVLTLNVLVAHARRLSPNISMQHVKRLSCILVRDARTATFLALLPLSALLLLLSSTVSFSR